MKLYNFSPSDQLSDTWLFHVWDGETNVPDPPYEALVCRRCGRFSYDDVFALGFENVSPFIRVKGDIFRADEGFLCINSRFRDLIEAHQFPGLALKPAGKTGWSIINIVPRFDVTEDVFQKARPELCRECKRPEILGGVRHLGQLKTLPPNDTFFSTRTDRQGSGASDRDLLLTEGIVQVLRHNKIKGGLLEQLLSEEEETKLSQAWQRGEKIKFPKGSRIVL